jgi:hypothetical protein
MEKQQNIYNILAEKPEETRPFETLRLQRMFNMEFKSIFYPVPIRNFTCETTMVHCFLIEPRNAVIYFV